MSTSLNERLEKRQETVKPLFEELSEYIHSFACERDHAGYVILRNNIKFIDSIDGASATADLYSLAATAKAHGADFYTYIQYILKKMPGVLEGMDGQDFQNMEALDAFMPWSAEYREYEQREWELRKKIPEEENFAAFLLDTRIIILL